MEVESEFGSAGTLCCQSESLALIDISSFIAVHTSILDGWNESVSMHIKQELALDFLGPSLTTHSRPAMPEI
jgi:hypothetical protein